MMVRDDLTEGHDSNNDGTPDGSSPANTGIPNGNDADFDGLDDGFDNLTASTDPTNNSLAPNSFPDTDSNAQPDRDWRDINTNIGGFTWADTDEDGIYESGAGETAISNALIMVFDEFDVFVDSMRTNASGTFLFTDLSPGNYYVQFSIPTGYNSISPINVGGNDQLDSDAQTGSGQTSTLNMAIGGAEIYEAAGFFSAVLPVTLTEFYGEEEECKVQLFWLVESAYDFSHFELERSFNGSKFEFVTSINGTNSDVVQTYQYTDRLNKNTTYYRLKMIDEDGTFEYSQIIAIHSDCELSPDDIRIFPNPIMSGLGNLNLTVEGLSGTQTIQIIDALGVVQRVINIDVNQEFFQLEIEIDQLAAGNYFVKFVGQRVRGIPFVVLRP